MRTQTIKIDATAPTAQIISPTEGDSLSGDLVVKVDATDAGAGVANVDLYVDGDFAGFSVAKISPYEITLPAGMLAPGTHRLKAVVTDALGNETRTAAVTVTVSAP